MQDHHHSGTLTAPTALPQRRDDLRLATSATIHCLIGCGFGEVAGTAAGGALGWAMVPTMIMGIIAGIIGGFTLGMLPLLRANYGFARAMRQVLIVEGSSIAVMETAEVIAQLQMPAIMSGSVLSAEYWLGMLISLAAGFAAAWPINLWLVRRGVRHAH